MFLYIFLFVFSGDLAFRAQGNGFKLLSGCLLLVKSVSMALWWSRLFICLFAFFTLARWLKVLGGAFEQVLESLATARSWSCYKSPTATVPSLCKKGQYKVAQIANHDEEYLQIQIHSGENSQSRGGLNICSFDSIQISNIQSCLESPGNDRIWSKWHSFRHCPNCFPPLHVFWKKKIAVKDIKKIQNHFPTESGEPEQSRFRHNL